MNKGAATMDRAAFGAAAISMPGQVRVSRSLGHHLIRITGEETGGAMGIWEEPVAPGEGAPFHVHHREDEMFYVIVGRFRFWCGEESFEAGQGATMVLPRGVPHRFENVGDTQGRLLITVSPGGFERFFLEVDALGEASLAQITSVAETYGLEFVGPEAGRAG